MAKPEMKRVLSSNVFEVGYDADSSELWVRFAPTVKNPAGPIGFYSGVPADEAESFMSSPSLGQALNRQIKPNYQFQYA